MQLLRDISTCGATAGVFAQPRPKADIEGAEVPQRSSPAFSGISLAAATASARHRSFLIAYRPLARLRALCLGIPSERPESQSLWGSSFVATGSPGALGAFFVYWLGRCCPKEVCAPYWFRQHVKGGRNGLALLSDNVVLS